MPLFRCPTCGCVENTAVGDYWMRQADPRCSECSTGKWHGRFEKRLASGWLIDQSGFLWLSEEGLPSHYRITGVVP